VHSYPEPVSTASSSLRVAIATCHPLPEPDPDEPLLLGALAAAGHRAEMAVWNDPAVDWSRFGLVVIRSTWDYYHAPGDFVDWLERISHQTRLANPANVVRWNMHKRYLAELAILGIPTVPTVYVPAGRAFQPGSSLAALIARTGWHEAIVKPAISAGSFLTFKVSSRTPTELEHAASCLARVLAHGHAGSDAMIQPYVPSVRTIGEHNLIFIGGEFSHAILKSPRLAGEHESVQGPVPISPAQGDLAERVLEAASRAGGFERESLLYARVDLMADDQGRPMLSELEVLEPSLFLKQHPSAIDRLVKALVAIGVQ
jgi:hypothetical protein